MSLQRLHRGHGRWAVLAVGLLTALILVSSLAGCGSPTARVVFVTATYTVAPQVVVVTATFTPAPPVAATETLLPPPTEPPPPPPVLAQPTSTLAPLLPTEPPPPPPTDTPPPPPDTPPPPPPAATAAPKPTAKPKVSLASYGVIYGHFAGGPETDENKYSVWIMRGDGSEASKVVDQGFEPAFSPQGHKFSYYRCFSGINVFDLDKKTDKAVVSSPYAEFASFSPDGKRLVFHEWVGSWWSKDVSLYVVNVDGSGRTKLPAGMRPSWSPKGDLIAYDSCVGTSCGIFVVGANGQGMRQVTRDGGGKPSWSPDGKRLLYSADVGGDPEIFVINLDGTGAKQLTDNSGNDTLPVYSPDGEYIYFLSDQNGKAWAIRLMRPDGSGIQTIRQIGVPPRWQFSRLYVGWW